MNDLGEAKIQGVVVYLSTEFGLGEVLDRIGLREPELKLSTEFKLDGQIFTLSLSRVFYRSIRLTLLGLNI